MSKVVKKVGGFVSGALKSVGNIVKKVAPIALPIASFAFPGLGAGIGSFLGASGTAAGVVGNAVLGGIGSAATGGNPLTGALTSGLGSYLGQTYGGLTGSAANPDAAGMLSSYNGQLTDLVNAGTISVEQAQQAMQSYAGSLQAQGMFGSQGLLGAAGNLLGGGQGGNLLGGGQGGIPGAQGGFNWGQLANQGINAGLGYMGAQQNYDAYLQGIDKQIAAQKDARTASENYAAEIDALQQERLYGQNQEALDANFGMTADEMALYQTQIDAKQQQLLSDVGLGNLSAQYDAYARQNQADMLSGAANQASSMARFTPYGITNNFGSSDASGNVKLDPRFQSQFDTMYGQSQNALQQAGGAFAATAPMGQAAQSMFQLGQGYLGTSPQAQAQKYMQDQMALLASPRERELAATESRLAARGRLGLATGATSGGMGAANPEMEALYNARRQQDLALAAQATQGGQQYAQFGANMMGLGGKTLQDMYATQSAAYNPYMTAIGGMQNLQGEAQKNAAFGAELGAKQAQAGANAGQLYLSGMTNAANAQYLAQQNPEQYDDYAAMQWDAINAMSPLEYARAEAQAAANGWGREWGMLSGQANMLAQQAANIPTASMNITPNPTPQGFSPTGSMLTGAANQNYQWFGS